MARILIVEDEDLNREVALVICQAAGHDCFIAHDGQEALERLATEDYDLLLVDVLMPNLDGIALTKKLRADPRWAATPIIGLTAKSSSDEPADMLAAGMTVIVTKPYRRRTLLDAIDRAMPQG